LSALADLDVRLFVLLNQKWTNGFLDWLMPLVTDFDHWRIPLILLLLVVLARASTETRLGLMFAIVAVGLADQISSSAIKPLFERERPFDVIEGTRQLVDAHGYAFPSSHAANTFAAGVFLSIRFPKFLPVLFLSFLVAYSRVYVGVHYPSDVLAGALLGTGIGLGCVAVERMARVRVERWIERRRRRRDGNGPPSGGDDDGAADGTAEGGDDQVPPAGAS
jgi:undecaprenyl-diphosphatase